MKVVICGGGVIGCSIAYYLAKKGVRSVVVERCDIACAASGKAGGFLAKDWCDSFEVGPLARKSFELHEQLAKEFGNTDYRKLNTLSVTAKEGTGKKQEEVPDWLDGDIIDTHSLGTTTTTAQVHPYKLTHAYFNQAQKLAGTSLHKGVVEGIEISDDRSKVTGVKVSGHFLEADVVVIAMGPWSGQASDWLKIPPVEGCRAHSILLVPKEPVTPHALFTDVSSKRDGRSRDPEVYPRPDGDVYICGMSDRKSLPVDLSQVEFNEQSCQTLQRDAAIVSSKLGDAELKLSQACYLPNPPDGLPVIGKVPGTNGAYIATGHTCWGILNSPGTGAAMAELIVDGKSSVVDLTPFDPGRFFNDIKMLRA